VPTPIPRVYLLLLALPATTGATPAPVYREPTSLEAAHRALPKPLRDQIEQGQTSFREALKGYRENSRRAGTQEEKARWLLGVERMKEAHYSYPIHYLQAHRKQPEYQNREDNSAIDLALRFYRIQYEDAKKRGLFSLPKSKE
jgi:hypothetical protein